MQMRHWLRSLLAGAILTAALIATPGLPVPGADRAGLGGQAERKAMPISGPSTTSSTLMGNGRGIRASAMCGCRRRCRPIRRPYTVGRWIYSDYGWYWDSREPFAWAVYHYGRWGYDPDYGWFWVPGDVWAPAWVQWRYSDNYVGWAPIGPGRQGYAYGAPVSYEPSIAEAWVFVQPRYMTSRAISHYALPIGALGPAFFSATTIYRPQFRGGVVYNYGVPRDRIARFAHTPIVVEKIYRMDRKSGWDRGGYGKGIRIYAPGITKSGRPDRGPKRFVDHPNEFRAKAKLKETFKGEPPKGWGPSAKAMVPIAKETRPDDWKKKWGPGWPRRPFDKDKDRDKDKQGSGRGARQARHAGSRRPWLARRALDLAAPVGKAGLGSSKANRMTGATKARSKAGAHQIRPRASIPTSGRRARTRTSRRASTRPAAKARPRASTLRTGSAAKRPKAATTAARTARAKARKRRRSVSRSPTIPTADRRTPRV